MQVEEYMELQKLRELLWLNHGCSDLYGDDGEMQCGKCRIDFGRDSIEEIERKLAQRHLTQGSSREANAASTLEECPVCGELMGFHKESCEFCPPPAHP